MTNADSHPQLPRRQAIKIWVCPQSDPIFCAINHETQSPETKKMGRLPSPRGWGSKKTCSVLLSAASIPFTIDFLKNDKNSIYLVTVTSMLTKQCCYTSKLIFLSLVFLRGSVRLRETDTNVNSSLGHVKRGHLGDRSDGPFSETNHTRANSGPRIALWSRSLVERNIWRHKGCCWGFTWPRLSSPALMSSE